MSVNRESNGGEEAETTRTDVLDENFGVSYIHRPAVQLCDRKPTFKESIETNSEVFASVYPVACRRFFNNCRLNASFSRYSSNSSAGRGLL